jgi:hypothetical protein
MLVVHLMRFADGHEVNIFRSRENFEALVDEDIVDQKIRCAVECDSGPDPHPEVASRHRSGDETPSARYGKNQKEGIVLFEETGFVYVVVFVKIPHQPVHQVFVRKPRDTFHRDESSEYNEGGSKGS